VKVIKPPSEVMYPMSKLYSVFLAGSIEMGKAENWQDKVEKALSDVVGIIINPRRDDWDSSWEQTLESPQFVEQVEWELTGLERCDSIMMYFDPDTIAPITLMEFGLYARCSSRKLKVCCPEGFWRKGNVDIVCREYGIQQYSTIEALIDRIRREAQHIALIAIAD